MSGQFLHAVNWTGVQTTGAVRLCLKTNTDVLDGVGEYGVGNTSERTRKPVLPVGKSGVGVLLLVKLLQAATSSVVGTELYTDLLSAWVRVVQGRWGREACG